MDRDVEHLKVLSIIYYVVAGLSLFGSCCGGLYAFMGMMIGMNPQQFNQQPPFGMHAGQPQPPPEFMMWMFVGMGCFLMAITVGMAILLFFAGQCLRKHKGYIYCLIVAGLCCLSVPLGTLLGVFSFIVLLRPTVKDLFTAEKLASQ